MERSDQTDNVLRLTRDATVATVTSPIPIHDDPIRTNIWITGCRSVFFEEKVDLTNSDLRPISGTMTIVSNSRVSANCTSSVTLANPGNYTLTDDRISASVTPSSGDNGTSVGVIAITQPPNNQPLPPAVMPLLSAISTVFGNGVSVGTITEQIRC